ncbi:MAG: alpha/beta fold hydrolase [Actinomycetota bacterium]
MTIPVPNRPRLLLIHGAWAGAWVWDGLRQPLADLGWESEALDLPGDGFHPIPAERVTEADFERCLVDALDAESGPVVLVGHSGGGMLVTLGATLRPDRVSHGIWIAGFLMPDGALFDDIEAEVAGDTAPIGVGPHIQPSRDGRTTTVGPDAAIAHFFHDAPDDIAAAVAARLTPQPVSGARLSTVAGPGFGDLPKLYVLASDDRSVLPAAQRLMCEGIPGLTVAEIDAGHAPQLTRAEELAELLDRWLTASLPPVSLIGGGAD